ncbi:MAG: hypothetical protein WA864_17580 [Acetobacteraceae bacterium]
MLFFARLSTTVALLAVAAMVLFSVSGCASQDHRDQLATLQQQCAWGWHSSCNEAAALAEANHQEAMADAGNVALTTLEVVGIIALVPLYILAGGDSDDDEVMVDEFGHRRVVHHAAAHWHR